MNIELARRMVRSAFECGSQLQELLPLLKEQCEPEDRRYAHDIAEAIDKANTALISPALAAHPGLAAEIERAVKRTGRYR
jgi:hypothetical protein